METDFSSHSVSLVSSSFPQEAVIGHRACSSRSMRCMGEHGAPLASTHIICVKEENMLSPLFCPRWLGARVQECSLGSSGFLALLAGCPPRPSWPSCHGHVPSGLCLGWPCRGRPCPRLAAPQHGWRVTRWAWASLRSTFIQVRGTSLCGAWIRPRWSVGHRCERTCRMQSRSRDLWEAKPSRWVTHVCGLRHGVRSLGLLEVLHVQGSVTLSSK